MSLPTGIKGETLRDQLEVVQKTTGVVPDQLQPPCELNELFLDAWKFFLELHSSRPSNEFGVSAISFSEMQSYFTLNQIEVQPWEVEIIKLFDNAALQVINESQEKRQQAQQKKK